MTVLTETIVPNVTPGHIADHLELHDEWNGRGKVFNITHSDYGAVAGGSAATNTAAINDAFTDAAAAASAGLPAKLVIPFGMEFPVTADGVIGASNVVVWGGGMLSTTDTATVEDPGHLISFPADATGWAVLDIRFDAPDNSIVAIKATSARDFAVEHCETTGCTLIRTNADIATYATIDTDPVTGNVCRGFKIKNNTCTATTDETNLAAILVLYCFDGEISGNRITDHHQGIQWWGGNAGAPAEGPLTNERKCGRLNISNNHVVGSLEGGIWGSMGDKITVEGNTVDFAGDLCIDLEGCTHSTVSGNTVHDGTNGGITTFFECYDINFTGNTVTTSFLNGRLARIQNGSGLPTVKGVRFTGNTFTCLNGVGYVHLETAEHWAFSDNTLNNCAILSRVNNQKYNTIENNTLMFTVVAGAAFKGIDAGENNLHGELYISGNKVLSTVTQPAGSKGIYVDQFDDNNPALTVIEGNRVSTGWTTSIESRWAGGSTGPNPGRSLIRNNITPITPTVTDAGTIASVTVKEGNRNSATLALWP